jgi:putative selenate reductase
MKNQGNPQMNYGVDWKKQMSDLMRPVSFEKLLLWIMTEYNERGSIFGIYNFYKHHNKHISFKGNNFLNRLELSLGPAAGPHTQLAQNLISAYITGSRFFELKTVQILEGASLGIQKPCIHAEQEGYNTEWSTELTVAEALNEYIKAWFLIKLIACEYNFGNPDGFIFNMSVGYDYQGITSSKIDHFIDSMKDAGTQNIWKECTEVTKKYLSLFTSVDELYIDNISPQVSQSVTLSTLHGCPAKDIEKIVCHLIEKKGLHTYIKCNPTLNGVNYTRDTLSKLGYSQISFYEKHFKNDVHLEDLLPMVERLLTFCSKHNKTFGVKLTNTFPTVNDQQYLTGEERYLSGKPLFPLSIKVAEHLSKHFGNKLNISFSGGVDFHNIKALYQCGIYPVTVATTLLKPGGYERMLQLADILNTVDTMPPINPDSIAELATECLNDAYYFTPKKIFQYKNDSALPIENCFTASCENQCPIKQDISVYMAFFEKNELQKAIKVILSKNPFPNTTGTYCPAFCESACTRNFLDKTVNIKSTKLIIAQKTHAWLLNKTKEIPVKYNKTVGILGGSITGMSCGYFIAQLGYDVTIYEEGPSFGGKLGNTQKGKEPLYKDMEYLKALGLKFFSNVIYKNVDCEIKINIPDVHKSVVEQIARGTELAKKFMAKEKDSQNKIKNPLTFNMLRNRIQLSNNVNLPCLHCDILCENCVSVCPNRANQSILLNGKLQIIHIDSLCNECGNCTSFCPYHSHPYLHKFTLFSNEDDLLNSSNDGFYINYPDTDNLLVRINGLISRENINSIILPYKNIIEEIYEHHAYWFV